MPSVIIRPAVKNDCVQMLKLVQELATYEKAPDEVTVTLEHFVESGFGPQPVWWAFVAKMEGIIVGFALYYVRYSTWKGQRMYLEDIIVTEEMRGKGIGKLLMDALITDGRNKGFHGMSWQVLDWNEPAINFYKKYGSRFDNGWINTAIDF